MSKIKCFLEIPIAAPYVDFLGGLLNPSCVLPLYQTLFTLRLVILVSNHWDPVLNASYHSEPLYFKQITILGTYSASQKTHT